MPNETPNTTLSTTTYHATAIYDQRRELFYGIVYSFKGGRMAHGEQCTIGHPYREMAIEDAYELKSELELANTGHTD